MAKRYYKYAEAHRTVNGIKQKLCVKCKEWKGKSEFRRERARKDARGRLCRDAIEHMSEPDTGKTRST